MFRASYALVQATVGVGTVIIPYIDVAYTRGGGKGTHPRHPMQTIYTVLPTEHQWTASHYARLLVFSPSCLSLTSPANCAACFNSMRCSQPQNLHLLQPLPMWHGGRQRQLTFVTSGYFPFIRSSHSECHVQGPTVSSMPLHAALENETCWWSFCSIPHVP